MEVSKRVSKVGEKKNARKSLICGRFLDTGGVRGTQFKFL
jgi:hypothetical protein